MVEGEVGELERRVGGPEEAVLPARAVEVAEADDALERSDLGGDRLDAAGPVEVAAAVAVAVSSASGRSSEAWRIAT